MGKERLRLDLMCCRWNAGQLKVEGARSFDLDQCQIIGFFVDTHLALKCYGME